MKYSALTCASAAFFVTSLALASDTWILDASRSNARLFQRSTMNSELVNTGVASVVGKVKLDAKDLGTSFVDLSIYPADEVWEHTLSPNGALRTGYVSDATDQTLLTFKSRRILRTGNGQLEVIGDLTLTRAQRTGIAPPTEDDAGPGYGDPVLHNETHKITFLFPSVTPAHVSGPLNSMLQSRGVLEIVGSARVDREQFPELVSAIKETNRPAVVRSRDRQMPVGEDNCRAACTGAEVAGEDYSAPQCTPGTGNQTTIVLDLRFLHTVPEPSVEAHSGRNAAPVG